MPYPVRPQARGKVVGMTGFEPAKTSRSQSGRSTKLSYIPGRDLFLLPTQTASRSAADGNERTARRTARSRASVLRGSGPVGSTSKSQSLYAPARCGRTRARADPLLRSRCTDVREGSRERKRGSECGTGAELHCGVHYAALHSLHSDAGNRETSMLCSTDSTVHSAAHQTAQQAILIRT